MRTATILLTLFLSMVGAQVRASDFHQFNADGITIYYKYINDSTEVEVVGVDDTSDLVIPEEVTYNGNTFQVTGIGDEVFQNRNGLTSVTLPSGVTSIGNNTFKDCTDLTAMTIPSLVTSIGEGAFYGCTGLTSITILDGVMSIAKETFRDCSNLVSIGLPAHLTSIGDYALSGCTSLTAIDLPTSLTSIGENAFFGCTSLTAINLPHSLTDMGQGVFSGCSGLTAIRIPSSVKSISWYAFRNCTGLTTIDIPYSVKEIGWYAFDNCSSLASVVLPSALAIIGSYAFTDCSSLSSFVIPDSVTDLGSYVFLGCTALKTITLGKSIQKFEKNAFTNIFIPTNYSRIENPFDFSERFFNETTYNSAMLYVPVGTLEKYKKTGGWRRFVHIEEKASEEPPQCGKPTISYQDGKLVFKSDTEGVEYQYTITDADNRSSNTEEAVELGATYRISVFATKAGYHNSETTTATLCWIDEMPRTEGVESGVMPLESRAVMVRAEDGWLTIEGAEDHTMISAYSLDGKELGTARSNCGIARLHTDMGRQTMVVVKIGQRSVKVQMR